jgi:hypothetical protein
VIEARHLSVLEHFHRTVSVDFSSSFGSEMAGGLLLFPGMFNRPGLWTRPVFGGLRLTMNARTVYEWNSWLDVVKANTHKDLHSLFKGATALGDLLWDLWQQEMPLVFQPRSIDIDAALMEARLDNVSFVVPDVQPERWVSLYISGSRGLSHELVRHGDWTAISQRSTRYVDEDESDWHWHPAIARYRQKNPNDLNIDQAINAVEAQARESYRIIRDTLEPWLRPSCDVKRDARKQARGAARGALGNALGTAMIFSASVHQWRHILLMRGAQGADAEIRQMAVDALRVLMTSRYASDFADFKITPSLDGIGEMLTCD